LLGSLYQQTLDALSGGASGAASGRSVTKVQHTLAAMLSDWSAVEFEAFTALPPPGYWLAFPPDTLARHACMVKNAQSEGAPLTLDTRIDRHNAITEVTVFTADQPGLMARLAGAIALAGGNIVEARIFTFTNGMALDSFSIQDFDSGDKLARLSIMVERVLHGGLAPGPELARHRRPIPARSRVFRVPPRLVIDNHASATHTIIELNGRDRPGLLYTLTQTVTDLDLQISTAKISTYGNKVIDVFYVKDALGEKITDETKLQHIRETLLQAFAEPLEETAA
jgi:[protein-PII] uridylyltransferase